MSNFPAFLEHDVEECHKHVDEEGYPRVYRWIAAGGSKDCPECSGKKTANVHYEHYEVNLRAYKRLYARHPEVRDAEGA